MRAVAVLLLTAFPAVALAEDGSPEAGARVFRKCTACHSADRPVNRVGPHLVGIVGRPAAALADYGKYSDAMKARGADGLTWDEAALSTYLTAPRKMVPGTKMVFSGLREEQDIADVIAYLKEAGGR